jgi:hypothetical protein
MVVLNFLVPFKAGIIFYQVSEKNVMVNKKIMKEKPRDSESNTKQDQKNVKEQPLPFHNPLKPEDNKKITQQDVENEEKFNEAQTERD